MAVSEQSGDYKIFFISNNFLMAASLLIWLSRGYVNPGQLKFLMKSIINDSSVCNTQHTMMFKTGEIWNVYEKDFEGKCYKCMHMLHYTRLHLPSKKLILSKESFCDHRVNLMRFMLMCTRSYEHHWTPSTPTQMFSILYCFTPNLDLIYNLDYPGSGLSKD